MCTLIKPKCELIFIDNKFVEGSSTPIFRKDSNGNTYQKRYLKNGKEYEILKNFPDENFIKKLLINYDIHYKWTELDYYWILEFTNE